MHGMVCTLGRGHPTHGAERWHSAGTALGCATLPRGNLPGARGGLLASAAVKIACVWTRPGLEHVRPGQTVSVRPGACLARHRERQAGSVWPGRQAGGVWPGRRCLAMASLAALSGACLSRYRAAGSIGPGLQRAEAATSRNKPQQAAPSRPLYATGYACYVPTAAYVCANKDRGRDAAAHEARVTRVLEPPYTRAAQHSSRPALESARTRAAPHSSRPALESAHSSWGSSCVHCMFCRHQRPSGRRERPASAAIKTAGAKPQQMPSCTRRCWYPTTRASAAGTPSGAPSWHPIRRAACTSRWLRWPRWSRWVHATGAIREGPPRLERGPKRAIRGGRLERGPTRAIREGPAYAPSRDGAATA